MTSRKHKQQEDKPEPPLPPPPKPDKPADLPDQTPPAASGTPAQL